MTPILTGIIASGISGHLTPPWSPEGAYDALATVNLSTNTASITFNGIPTGYKHLQIRAVANNNSAPADANYTFNGDTSASYAWHLLVGNGSAAQAYNAVNNTFLRAAPYFINTANVFGAGVTDILDYQNTNKFKTVKTLTGFDDNTATYSQIQYYSGLWRNTSAINSITITASAGNFTANSQFALYGVK